jgi:hypothetical protein
VRRIQQNRLGTAHLPQPADFLVCGRTLQACTGRRALRASNRTVPQLRQSTRCGCSLIRLMFSLRFYFQHLTHCSRLTNVICPYGREPREPAGVCGLSPPDVSPIADCIKGGYVQH